MFAACSLTTTHVGLLQGICSSAALHASPRAVVACKARAQHPPRRFSGPAAARNAATPAPGLDAATAAVVEAAAAAADAAAGGTPPWALHLLTSLEELHSSVKELQSSMNSLQSSMNSLQSSMDGLQSSMNSLQSSMDGLQSSMDGLQSSMDGLQSSAARRLPGRRRRAAGAAAVHVRGGNVAGRHGAAIGAGGRLPG